MKFITHKGVEHERYNNPADFFVDVIIRNEKTMHGIDASEEDVIQMKGKQNSKLIVYLVFIAQVH